MKSKHCLKEENEGEERRGEGTQGEAIKLKKRRGKLNKRKNGKGNVKIKVTETV